MQKSSSTATTREAMETRQGTTQPHRPTQPTRPQRQPLHIAISSNSSRSRHTTSKATSGHSRRDSGCYRSDTMNLPPHTRPTHSNNTTPPPTRRATPTPTASISNLSTNSHTRTSTTCIHLLRLEAAPAPRTCTPLRAARASQGKRYMITAMWW